MASGHSVKWGVLYNADDLAMVERIDALAGQPWDDDVRTALQTYLDDHPRGRHGGVQLRVVGAQGGRDVLDDSQGGGTHLSSSDPDDQDPAAHAAHG